MFKTIANDLMDINKIIQIVREIREENGGPTMSLGSGQIAGTKEAGGDDPPVFNKSKKK